tara:strand:- start:88 stop:390 length:303 start_codon:yes stop_codon:yes gene_type:complete
VSNDGIIKDESKVFAKGTKVRTVRQIQVSAPSETKDEMEYIIVPPGKTGTIKQVLPHVIVVFDSDDDFGSCREISWHKSLLLSKDLVPLMDGKPALRVIK